MGRHFLSDNAAGVHRAVMLALERANVGHAEAYGRDPVTAGATALFQRRFGPSARPFFVLTGTGANVLALQSLTRSFEAVVACAESHLHRDECGAPEKFLGSKILTAPGRLGKIGPDDVRTLLAQSRMVHRVQPRAVSISQPTEWGAVYTPAEVRSLSALCREHGLRLHMDGARLCNAAVHLGLGLKEATADLGVDVLSFGGTKNGLMGAEAVVFFSDPGAEAFPFFRKQGMHLISKMRFVSAQFQALLEGDLWEENARRANAMASLLGEEARKVGGVELAAPVETNAVFARLPRPWVAPLQDRADFHVWDPEGPVVRWVASFDTEEEDVRGLIRSLRDVARRCPTGS